MSFMQQAVREWAWNVGDTVVTRQWILSDYDTWERNPHYVGPDLGYPDEEGVAGEVFLSFKSASDFAKNYAQTYGGVVKVSNYKNRCWVVYY